MKVSFVNFLLPLIFIISCFIIYTAYQKNNYTKVYVINSPTRNHSSSYNDVHHPQTRRFIEPIHTRGYTYFSNIGYLYDGDLILPLYGKQTYRGSITWNYYVLSEHHIKIPLIIDNKDCLDYIGCRELYHNDTIYLDAYKRTFHVYLYKPQIYY